MQKIKSKKGFTLAELLIVVAIIAVLTAIAVPLFVSALSNAEERTFNANQHAVKSAAVAYILENQADFSKADWDEVKGSTKHIKATGTFSENGDFSAVKVEIAESVTPTDIAGWKGNGKTEIVVEVLMTDISKA